MWWTQKRLQWIPPLTIFVVTVGLGLILFIRGTSADGVVEDPKSVDDGVICQVLRAGKGKPVRCAVVLPINADKAWHIIRDYDRFPELFDTAMWSIDLEKIQRSEEHNVHLTGTIRSIIGTWPYVLTITHEQHEDRMVACWDEPSDVFPVNRGDWTIRPLGEDQVLLSYTLEVDKANTPGFLVNNVLLDQIRIAVERVRERAQASNATASP